MIHRMKYLMIMFAFLLVASAFISWSENRDQEMRQAAFAYERCVRAEYRMTPVQYYEINKEYPLCGN